MEKKRYVSILAAPIKNYDERQQERKNVAAKQRKSFSISVMLHRAMLSCSRQKIAYMKVTHKVVKFSNLISSVHVQELKQKKKHYVRQREVILVHAKCMYVDIYI